MHKENEEPILDFHRSKWDHTVASVLVSTKTHGQNIFLKAFCICEKNLWGVLNLTPWHGIDGEEMAYLPVHKTEPWICPQNTLLQAICFPQKGVKPGREINKLLWYF